MIDRAPFRCAHAFADVRAPCPRCAAPLWFPTPTAPLARLRCPHAGCEAPLVVTTEGDAHPLATVDAHLAVEAVPLFACPREQVEANLLLTVRALALTYLGAVMGMWLRIQHPASQLIVSSPTLLLIPFFLTRAGFSFWTRRRAARRAAALRGRRLRAAEQLFTADAPSWVPSLPSPAPLRRAVELADHGDVADANRPVDEASQHTAASLGEDLGERLTAALLSAALGFILLTIVWFVHPCLCYCDGSKEIVLIPTALIFVSVLATLLISLWLARRQDERQGRDAGAREV